MNNYKIKVNDLKMADEVRDLFELLGYEKSSLHRTSPFPRWVLAVATSNPYSSGCDLDCPDADDCEELTLTQLRDLVVLHRNDIYDANWVTEGDDQIYQDSNGKSFIFREQGWDELQRHEMRQAMWEKVKPKPQPTEAEQGLISGADALRALADGKEVEYLSSSQSQDNWINVSSTKFDYTEILDEKSSANPVTFKFRIKPRTIKLSLEIPAPFEPKDDDRVWVLDVHRECGYGPLFFNSAEPKYTQFGAWRTEEEIKQVVAALRGGIKG